jgi:hypothetical protein
MLEPHAAELGFIVSVLKIGAGLTVTVDVALWPIASCTVIVTGVSTVTLPGSSTIVLPLGVCATGRTAGLLETTKKGAAPPLIVRVIGVFANAVTIGGRIDKGPGAAGPGWYGLFGAPLPPPQPPRASNPPSATSASAGRSQRAIIRFGAMKESLMMLS